MALVCTGLLAGGTAIGLGLLEAGLRLYEYLHPPAVKGFFWVPRPEYGWGLAADREGLFYDDHGEFRSHVRINSHGLHDVEHRHARTPGTFRILVLGDSYIEAFQVELGQGTGRLLQDELTTRTARRVEVISAGVSGWGTDNELLYFRHEGRRYQPDLVLLFFTAANDVRENYPSFNRMAAAANLHKPAFAVNGAGALEMRPGPPPVPPLPWWRRFLIGEYVFRGVGGTFTPSSPRGAPPGVPADMWVYAPVYRDEVAEAWRVTEALIRALRNEAVAGGAEFAVVVHSGPWSHREDRWRQMLMQDPQAAATWDRHKPRRLIAEILSRAGIPFTDLFDAFQVAGAREPLFFRVDPHWNSAGHRVVAQATADFVLARGLAPGEAQGGAPR
jgi:hypothetical protein